MIVLLVGLAWFGRSAWGGHFLADDSPSMDIYHLSTLYERWAHYIARGEFPAWMPEFSAGYPAPASWMYGLWYPGHLIFGVLPADAAWTWAALLHMVLGAVGVHRLVESETDDELAACTAGVIFGLSEILIGRTLYGHLNIVAPVAWAPWVFLHLRGIAQGRRNATMWCVVCTTLGLLSGHVQVWFYVVPAALVYALVLGRSVESRVRYLGRLALAAVFVVCLTAPQWLSTLELTLLSDRTAASSADVADFSAPLYVLFGKLFPGALGYLPDTAWVPAPAEHEFGATGGLFLLALALPALLRRRREDAYWAAIAVAGLLLAPGVHNPLSSFLNELPPMRFGRTPARALLLTTLALAVLAGRGLAEWRRVRRESPDTVTRLTLITAAVTLTAGLLGAGTLFMLLRERGIGEHAGIVARAMVTSVVLAGAVLALPVLAARERRAFLAAPALVVASVCLGGAPPARSIPSDFYTMDWASLLPAPLLKHRLHLLSGRLPNVERQGLRTLREICYVDAHWYHAFASAPNPRRAVWLDVGAEIAGIPRERVMTGVLTPDDLLGKPYDGIGAGVVFDAARVERDDARVLAAVDAGELSLYLAEPAEGAGAAQSRPVPGARVEVSPSPSPNRFGVDVETPVAGWLFVSEKYFPGWTATVNGAPAAIHRANVTFRAVRVPAGRSHVEFRYAPWTVRLGMLLAFSGLLAGAFVLWRRRAAAGRVDA